MFFKLFIIGFLSIGIVTIDSEGVRIKEDNALYNTMAVVHTMSNTDQTQGSLGDKKYFNCEYCGVKQHSISSLTSATCPRHPQGAHKGKHKLYEGSVKAQYVCKYCGSKHRNLASLTSGSCVKHPKGVHKGKHAPAL